MPRAALSLDDVEKRLDEILHIDPSNREGTSEELLAAREAFLEICRRRAPVERREDGPGDRASAFIEEMSQGLPPDFRMKIYHLFGPHVPEGTEEIERLLEAFCSPVTEMPAESAGIQAFHSTAFRLCNRINVCFAEEATLLSDIIATFYHCNANSREFEDILQASRQSHKDMLALSIQITHLGCIKDYSILPRSLLDLFESPEKIDALTKEECFAIISSLAEKFFGDVPAELEEMEPHAVQVSRMLSEARSYQEKFISDFRGAHKITDDMIPKRRCCLERITDPRIAAEVAELARLHRRDPKDSDFRKRGGFVLVHPVTEFQALGRSGLELISVRSSDEEGDEKLGGFIAFVGGVNSARIDPKPPVEIQTMAVAGYCAMIAVNVEHVYDMLLMAMGIHLQRSETDLVTVEIAIDNRRSFIAALASGAELLPGRLLEDDLNTGETHPVSHLEDNPPPHRSQSIGGVLFVSPALRERFKRVWRLDEAVGQVDSIEGLNHVI